MRGAIKTTLLLASVAMAGSGCLFFDVDDDGDGSHGGQPYCGDRVVNNAEQCDDGNTVAGDGCFQCQLEGGGGDALVSASWTLRNIATGATTACPAGFDTVALYSQEVTSTGSSVGSPIIDLFDCAAGAGTSAPLARTFYKAWIEVTNTNNTSTYARSTEAYVDVTVSDKSFSAQILNDGGYFLLAWDLIGASTSNSLTCAQAGASGGIDVVATDVSDSANTADDVFDCEDGQSYTAGFETGSYTVAVSALDASQQPLGTPVTLTNKVIASPNLVTNLGTVEIPITGL
jgi:cysteine-rich repeat protein